MEEPASLSPDTVYEPPWVVEVGTFAATTFGSPDQEIPEDTMLYPIEG